MSLVLDIPVLETERLRLVSPVEIDLEVYTDFFASQTSRTVGGPLHPVDVWGDKAKLIGHWVMRGYGFWAVKDRQDDTFLGVVGLYFPLGWPEAEIGWTLMPSARGKGYATEAARAARRYAYEALGWTTAVSLIVPENTASRAVAGRLGARLETHYAHPTIGRMELWRHISPAELAQGTAP